MQALIALVTVFRVGLQVRIRSQASDSFIIDSCWFFASSTCGLGPTAMVQRLVLGLAVMVLSRLHN